MSPLRRAFELDAESYSEADRWKDRQRAILRLLEDAIGQGDTCLSIFVSYSAALLNLGQNRRAVQVLEEHPTDSSAYCQNMAIALVDSGGDAERVRYWNKKASTMPERPFEIVAYVDWQGY